MTVARSGRQRTRDTLARLERDVDVWVATADPETATPHLVPLSFWWDGETLMVATAAASPTGRNLSRGGPVRLALGATRDVVMIDGTVAALPSAELSKQVGDVYAAKTGFDPRGLSAPYLYFRIRPVRVQAWREANELTGRTLMRDGRWLHSSA